MREGWEIKKLGDVCDIICGQDYKSVQDENGKYPIYGTGGIMGYASQYRCPANSIIIGRKGNINNPLFVERNFWNVDTAFAVVPSTTYLISKFFYLFCKSYDFAKHDVSVTIPSLRRTDILKIDVPIPPLPEQQKIVDELDCLSKMIELKKKQLETYDKLAQSIFYDMFGDPISNEKGWEVSSIKDVCTSIIRGPFGSALKKEFFVEPSSCTYKVYEQKHAIQKDASIGTYHISKEMFESLSRFEVKSGDIIMSCSGTIGEFYEIPKGAEQGVINQALLKYTLKNSIKKIYFLYAMEWVKSIFEKKGSGLQNIGSVQTIKAMEISLPPFHLQQQFAEKIEAIEKQKELIKQTLKGLEELFNSRMDYYFN